jgi:hypothetical protein
MRIGFANPLGECCAFSTGLGVHIFMRIACAMLNNFKQNHSLTESQASIPTVGRRTLIRNESVRLASLSKCNPGLFAEAKDLDFYFHGEPDKPVPRKIF